MQNRNNKTVTILLMAAFLTSILGLGLFWLIASNSSDSSGFKSSLKPSKTPALTNTRPSSAPFTETLITQEEAHRLVNETAGHLLEKNQISLREVMHYKEQLSRADKYYAQGDYKPAMELYNAIGSSIETHLHASEAQTKAEQLGQELLEKIRVSEHLKATAPAAWASAIELSDQGTIAYKESDYPRAAEHYATGLEQLTKAETVRKERMEAKIQTIHTQLDTLQVEAAEQSLKDLVNWEPDHLEIPHLESMIDTIRSLLPQLEQAQTLLSQQQYPEALELYRTLLEEHPTNSTLRKHYDTAKASMLEDIVRPLIAKAEALFKEGKLNASLETLIEAQKLAPEEPSIGEAITAVKQAIRQEEIQKNLKRAYDHYTLKQWREAREAYQRVLALDPENKEAQEGSFNAGQQLSLYIRFEEHMRMAQDYAQQGRFPKALAAFNNAMQSLPEGAQLNDKHQALRALLERQSQKVSVVIHSNDRTWVSIIGAMKPEQFDRRTLELYPDVYTFKGHRAGYEPVSLDVAVNADKQPVEVTIEAKTRR